MKALLLRVLAIFLFLCCCGFHGCLNPTHRIFLWNHSDHELVVVSGYPGLPRLYDTSTVRPGEKRILTRFISAGSMRNGDTLKLKIFLGDSLIYRQDTLSTKLWEIRRREDLSTDYSYTLHAFNASTRQPSW